MRFKQKLEELNTAINKTDDILLKSISNDIFRKIKSSINNYMQQIDIEKDKKWMEEKKQIAYDKIIKNLIDKKKEI